MIRDIVAIVEDGEKAGALLDAVGGFARQTGAFLKLVVLTPAQKVSPAIAPLESLYVPDVVLLGDDAANVDAVRTRLAQTGCAFEIVGLYDDGSALARAASLQQLGDLIVIGGRGDWPTAGLRTRVIETLLRSSGTPILLLPAGLPMPRMRHAVLGWTPSSPAFRALHDLVRLAEPGAAIDVVTIAPAPRTGDDAGDSHGEVERHLARHGFVAQGQWIIGDHQPDATTLERYARGVAADLLVVGGTTHSHLRNRILGGVTSDLIERADTAVLISQ